MIVKTADDVALILAAVRDGVSVGEGVSRTDLERRPVAGSTTQDDHVAALESVLLEKVAGGGSVDIEVERTVEGVVLHFNGAAR